jgi:hypothetical protein
MEPVSMLLNDLCSLFVTGVFILTLPPLGKDGQGKKPLNLKSFFTSSSLSNSSCSAGGAVLGVIPA